MANNENEFENEPLGEGFNQDVDFGEFEASPKRASIGDVWKSSPGVKVGLMAAAVLVVVAVVALFSGEKAKTPDSRVGGGAQELKEAPGTSEVTPVMKEALEEHNQQRLEDALKQGASSIPTPIEPPKVLLGVPESETAGEDPLVRWKRMQEERVRLQREQEQFAVQAQVDPDRQGRIDGLTQAMVNQFTDIMSKRGIPQLNNLKVTDLSKIAEGQADGTLPDGLTTVSVGQSGAQQTAIGPQKPVKVILPAGQVTYAQMLVEANSDIPGPVVAMLVSGPFSGSRVLGSFSKQEEYLTIQFSTLVTKEGYSVPITATAVDPDTTLTGMATDVDHRYLKRIILPAAASFLEGLGSAIAETGSTNVTVTGETVATETQDLNTEEELAKAGEEAFSKVSEIFEDEGSKTEILVRVRAGTPFGLLFTASVTDQQLDAARFGGVQQGQQGQQQLQGQQPPPLTPLQMLQQGLGNQVMLQQQPANPYYPGAATVPAANNVSVGSVPYPVGGGTSPQVTYTDGLQ